MLWALYTLGFDEEANDFFYFVADIAEAEEGQLQIMYGIGGESKLEEQELAHLSGYDRSRPVRIGNGAYDQDQHDVWGAVLDSIYLHTRSRDQLSDRLWPIIKRQVEAELPTAGPTGQVGGGGELGLSPSPLMPARRRLRARLARIRHDSAADRRSRQGIHADIFEHGPATAACSCSTTSDALMPRCC
jgi:hypothetical protein